MCVWIKYTSYQWCWQGWRLFLMSTAIKLMCTWQDVKKKSNPFKTKSNVKKVHSGLYKQHVIADRNNLYSHSTRVPSLDPKEQDLHYSWFRPRQPGEMLWSVSWNTDTGGLPNSSWEGGKSFIRCYNQQMPFIKWKGKPQTHYLFWASWTAHMIGLKMELIDYDTSPNKAVPKWLFLGLFCDHTPGRCYGSAGIGLLLLCRFQNLKKQRGHLAKSFSCLPVKQ